MRTLPLLAVALVVLASYTAYSAVSAPQATRERHYALDVVAVPCATADGVCLAYGGTMPGPSIDIDVGDTLVVTLTNRIAETIGAIDADPAVKARLAAANVSFHTHGMAPAPDMDGIAAHHGTQLVASFAPPGGSYTYRLRAPFAGTWHYHDHVLGQDGTEGTERGLYGALVVRAAGEARPDRLLDLRLHDAGPNQGAGLDAAVAAGSSFEIAVAVLGDRTWNVDLKDPSGATVATFTVGAGVSERFRVDDAAAGAYRWTARWGATSHTGEVVAS